MKIISQLPLSNPAVHIIRAGFTPSKEEVKENQCILFVNSNGAVTIDKGVRVRMTGEAMTVMRETLCLRDIGMVKAGKFMLHVVRSHLNVWEIAEVQKL